jgi:flagellar biosynthesis/type III secretory pathway chaperone
MNQDLIAAGGLLADTLAEENAALTALDLPRAAGMLADKQRAATGFIAAQATPVTAANREATERLLQRLRSLANDNQALLERAIAVQGRVIGVIARAAAPALAPSGYGAQGNRSRATRPTALAISARA